MIGRNREFHFLEKVWASKDAFLMVSGREHIGKSAFIRSFTNDKNVLYFSARNVSDALNKNYFDSLLTEQYKIENNKRKSSGSWKDLFRLYGDLPGIDRKILVLDNFQYLMNADEDYLKTLKNAWENYLKPNFVMLIVILPNGQYLDEIKEYKTFYSKISYHINLPEVSFASLMKDIEHKDFNQLMMMYSITGGVPKYWKHFSECIEEKDFISKIKKLFFDTDGLLLTEPYSVIEKNFADQKMVNSVLLLLAQGYHSIHQIEYFCNYRLSDIFSCIKELKHLGIVKEKKSVLGKTAIVNKNPCYYIADPVLFFWYSFVFLYYDDIKNGNIAEAENNLLLNYSSYVDRCFEMAMHQVFVKGCQRQTIPINGDIVGQYFDEDSDAKIDLVAIDHKQKILFFGDCGFNSESYDLLNYQDFIVKCNNINNKVMKQYKDYKIMYAVFANNQFDKELLDYALENENLVLYNGISIYALLK